MSRPRAGSRSDSPAQFAERGQSVDRYEPAHGWALVIKIPIHAERLPKELVDSQQEFLLGPWTGQLDRRELADERVGFDADESMPSPHRTGPSPG